MSMSLNKSERELIKLANFFIKNTEKFIQEGKLDEEHSKVITACNNLIEKINLHAGNREEVIKTRENLKTVIKDNASCPSCHKNTHIKYVGVDTEEKWKCNRYKCRRCNILFTWNRPNNPWDMVPYIEALVIELEQKVEVGGMPELAKAQTLQSIEEMKQNVARIQSVIEVSDQEFQDMQERELEMSKLVHEFKNYLLIEKIKMDKWKNPFSEN